MFYNKIYEYYVAQNRCKVQEFCIYGAGITATSMYTALKYIYNCSPVYFIVSDKKGNPDMIDKIPVKVLSECMFDSNIIFLIAVPESHHDVIRELLGNRGIKDRQIVFVDNCMENKIMGEFYGDLPEFVTVDQIVHSKEYNRLLNIESKRINIEILQAKCHMDKLLAGKYTMPNYLRAIQVGAMLTDKQILDLRDDLGDNISNKNGNYCELTASYYAWKHSNADYKGLCHYRRIFDIDDEQMHALLEKKEKWDVILPYPSVHYPNISSQHTKYVSETDWNAMLCALEETAPKYYEKLESIFQDQFFYNFNMLIARREIFDDYCNFLFSVLGRTEELTTPKGWERTDRFAGYLGENLTTLYFMANKHRLKIIHTGKIWLV